jgi:hypothetical protein
MKFVVSWILSLFFISDYPVRPKLIFQGAGVFNIVDIKLIKEPFITIFYHDMGLIIDCL